MGDIQIYDPELSDLLKVMYDSGFGDLPSQARIRGVEAGIIWAHLWDECSGMTAHRTPIHEGNIWLAERMAELIGWTFEAVALPEDWDHYGETNFMLGVFTAP